MTTELTISSTHRLNNGVDIPRLGLGVFRAGRGKSTRDAVLWALEAGYRHIDTAQIYGNETEVGQALAASGLPRDEVFVTTKLWNSDHGYDATLKAFEGSCERLGLDVVDLYLIHWPVPGKRLETWQALESLLADGRCRAIGVSNFMPSHVEALLAAAEVVPAVNQIEIHPFGQQAAVAALCREQGIAVEAYSPLTKGRRLDDRRLAQVAEAVGRTPAQVLIRWSLQRGYVVIPKSANRERIRENAAVFDFELSDAQMAALDDLEEGLHTAWNPNQTP